MTTTAPALHRVLALATTLATLAALAACAGSDADHADHDEAEVSPELDGKADAASELSVRAGDTTLSVAKTVAVRTGPHGPELVLRGRTSRTLTDARGFIFDDVYGDATLVSPRVFELVWPLHAARSLLDGVDQFVGMTFVPSSTRPAQLTARVVVRPRLYAFEGSSKIYLTAELAPVVVAGEILYRLSGRTYGANTGVRLVVAGDTTADVGTVTRDGSERFTIDLEPRQALALIAGKTELQVIADLTTGGFDKRVRVGAALKKLGMTAQDAETAWPPARCTLATRSCLTSLAPTTLDLGKCGEAVLVNACAADVGIFVDETSFLARLDAARTQLATPAARADAIALAGADRADQFLYGAEQTIESQLQHMFGRWFLSAAARDALLERAVAAGYDAAYAFPLDLIEPHDPSPGNAAVMRQVAADAVLAELARMDFLHSEFGRTLEQLTRQFRVQHVADIKALRESAVPEPYGAKDVYLTSWLGLYIEVVIDRATGAVDRTYVEID